MVINCVIEMHLFSYICWFFCTGIWSRNFCIGIYVYVWHEIIT